MIITANGEAGEWGTSDGNVPLTKTSTKLLHYFISSPRKKNISFQKKLLHYSIAIFFLYTGPSAAGATIL